MALAQLVSTLTRYSGFLWDNVLDEKRRSIAYCPGGVFSGYSGTFGKTRGFLLELGARLSWREVAARARLKVTEAPTIEGGMVGRLVEIPVTCYQILGLSEKAEKDEVVKAVMDLKDSDIEDGFTGDLSHSRKMFLMDVRDKLLFEPEYSGNLKERIPPRSSLHIPWSWLPSALCLLQEVGEEKIALHIGRAALQHSDVEPYAHDVLLCMALAECTIAKAAFEENKIYEGFEALAQAQYLLKSKASLGSTPLILQEKESLEELVPACTLEIISMPRTPDNAERRKRAIEALRELLRQGLDVETSCRVQDWHCFLNKAMNKLMAVEIVDLLPWDKLATARTNKKLLESQNQKVVISFDCFYLAMTAHLAFGFSTRQLDVISKAKTICDCLIASEGVELKFEQAFCSFLLGQVSEKAAFEKLQQLEISGNSSLQNYAASISKKDIKEARSICQSLESWLKDSVLSLFADTRDCPPSLANFSGGQKRMLNCRKQKIETSTSPYVSNRSPSLGLSFDHTTFVKQPPIKLTRHLGEAVKQLAPISSQSQHSTNKDTNMTSNPSNSYLKRLVVLHDSKSWIGSSLSGDVVGRIAYVSIASCLIFGAAKMLSMHFGQARISHMLQFSQMMKNNAAAWTFSNAHKLKFNSPIDKTVTGNVMDRRQMSLAEAESLVKKWQDIKARALGPDHQIHSLPQILCDSMLLKWQDLAMSAKKKECFWKLVLLNLSVSRAEIVVHEFGIERAEVEALIEEAAELANEYEIVKPTYHSTYKVQYSLKKEDDGSWKFCNGGIESS
ncbi:hypothetical protein HPP92_022060 [Vanilla planifolia]|uniref:ARC6 IMS domain-containing protein n=1 Tax=Vanilla planifolia TaxID=51239 RepID=A0A835PTA1_VANPL|nr:hypothetical protein HPP92_022060 [Vanilla planifolia]